MKNFILLCLTVASAASCTPSMTQMRARLDLELKKCVGLSFSSEVTPKKCGRSLVPSADTRMVSGDRAVTFSNYWQSLGISGKDCQVTIVIRGDVIVDVIASGSGCYMPY